MGRATWSGSGIGGVRLWGFFDAYAHLTWTGNNEENWPQVTFYDSLDEWIERVMEADHRESS